LDVGDFDAVQFLWCPDQERVVRSAVVVGPGGPLWRLSLSPSSGAGVIGRLICGGPTPVGLDADDETHRTGTSHLVCRINDVAGGRARSHVGGS
jgi:hypothetical protein